MVEFVVGFGVVVVGVGVGVEVFGLFDEFDGDGGLGEEEG